MTSSGKNAGSDTRITYLGVTYTLTQLAHQSETPLETCSYCEGSGQLYSRKCTYCKGRGSIVHRKAAVD